VPSPSLWCGACNRSATQGGVETCFLLGDIMAGDPLTDDEAAPFRFTSNYSPDFDPFYHVIGRLAVYWSEFEFAVNAAIWELANVSRMAGTA